MEDVARASQDHVAGPLRLGVIPTVAPYLMPLLLGPLRQAYPAMTIELWEDLTHVLLDLLRKRRLDAALIASEVHGGDLTAVPLFVEPFLAALPVEHRLASRKKVKEKDLAPDILILADGHCLAAQALAACGRKESTGGAFQAASLDTLINLVAAGYGTTLAPALAASALADRHVALRPLAGHASRTVRLASRSTFPRPRALKAIERIVLRVVSGRIESRAKPVN